MASRTSSAPTRLILERTRSLRLLGRLNPEVRPSAPSSRAD